MKPTVTAIIATYNKSGTLRYAIDSILWQTYEDFELWVIGDACTDDSADLVTSYTDSRVNWYNLPENTGYQSGPHNEGLNRAKGELIAYLNHDDIWLPNHLEVLVNCIEETGADVAYSILEWITPWDGSYPDIPRYPDASVPPEASATVHRKDLVGEIGFWREPTETYSVPRADFFRRAQFVGRRFELAPHLTVLKFNDYGEYASTGRQPEYMERIRNESNFAHRQLAQMLARARWDLDKPVSPKRFFSQLKHSMRRWLVRHQIDPARVAFWSKPGKFIKKWRKERFLEPLD